MSIHYTEEYMARMMALDGRADEWNAIVVKARSTKARLYGASEPFLVQGRYDCVVNHGEVWAATVHAPSAEQVKSRAEAIVTSLNAHDALVACCEEALSEFDQLAELTPSEQRQVAALLDALGKGEPNPLEECSCCHEEFGISKMEAGNGAEPGRFICPKCAK